jgi:hypothetical protein
MNTNRSTPPIPAIALALALFFAGPVSADEPTPVIGGTVSYQGKPLDRGRIIFFLKDDEFVGGKIKGGTYKVTRVPVGAWRVSIEAMGMPAKYASEEATVFTVQVRPGANLFDLDLK